ncbi:MAG: hypothetical protein IPM47_20455 [Sphingobacteriales bacterium]|nr:MAG: hypothetical protein IPM47_20455 [Sphingobacteriales bacterium]
MPERESRTIRDYVLGLEYLNEEKEGYYHEEGRINLLEGGRIEYTLKDHLGNGRVYCYHDAAENEAKTLQETHYYPFGLPIQKLSPNFEAAVGVEVNNYQYNGIELVEDFGLQVSHALFRTLDPQTGRWWQIDPKAEEFYAWSPYNSNLDNPILLNDPKGDCPLCPLVIGPLLDLVLIWLFKLAQTYMKEEWKMLSQGLMGLALLCQLPLVR